MHITASLNPEEIERTERIIKTFNKAVKGHHIWMTLWVYEQSVYKLFALCDIVQH